MRPVAIEPDVEAMIGERLALANVDLVVEEIGEDQPLGRVEVARDRDPAMGSPVGQVDHHDAHSARPPPAIRDEILVRGVVVGRDVQQLPLAVMKDRLVGDAEQLHVGFFQFPVRRLRWRRVQGHRQVDAAALELALVEKAQAGQRAQQGGEAGEAVAAESRDASGFVVVFQEAGHPLLVGERRREVRADFPGRGAMETVVEALVVGVAEPELLQHAFHVPVHLGHPEEVRGQRRDRLRPEFRGGRGPAAQQSRPGLAEDLVQHQHRHVAAQAVAVPRDRAQGLDERIPRFDIEEVDLRGIGPRREAGIASASNETGRCVLRLDQEEGGRIAVVILLRAPDEVVGVAADPAVVGPRVVRHEVEDELDVPLAQFGADGVHLRPGSDATVGRVIADGEGRPHDRGDRPFRSRVIEDPERGRVGAKQVPPGNASLPEAQEVDEVEAEIPDPVPLGVGHVGKRETSSGGIGEFIEPGPGVQLVEMRIRAPVPGLACRLAPRVRTSRQGIRVTVSGLHGGASMARMITLAAAAFAIVGAAMAGPIEDAASAFKRKDFETAARLWRTLAEEGNALARTNLGSLYENGTGVARDPAEAVKWYRLAAEQGHAPAELQLAFMYRSGKGVPKNDAEAVKWIRRAADRGYLPAEDVLGSAYESGVGIPRDYTEAARWYRMAADRGHAPAELNLGRLYENGLGFAQDHAEAAKWYRRAAERGLPAAQNSLGVMHATGRGVAQDYVQALKWFKLAAFREQHAASRDRNARNRDRAAAKMTPAQLEEAEKLAREWNPK